MHSPMNALMFMLEFCMTIGGRFWTESIRTAALELYPVDIKEVLFVQKEACSQQVIVQICRNH